MMHQTHYTRLAVGERRFQCSERDAVGLKIAHDAEPSVDVGDAGQAFTIGPTE